MILFAVAVLDDVTQNGSFPSGGGPCFVCGGSESRLSMTESFFHLKALRFHATFYLMSRGSFFLFLRASLIGGGFVIFVLHFFFLCLFCPMKWDDLALHYNTLQIIQRSHDCTGTQRDAYLILLFVGWYGGREVRPTIPLATLQERVSWRIVKGWGAGGAMIYLSSRTVLIFVAGEGEHPGNWTHVPWKGSF